MIDLIPGFSLIEETAKSVDLLSQMKISDYVLTFFIFSAIGWLIETIYCSLGNHRFINRGFLTGPLCPIYGTGGLIFSLLISRFWQRWYLVLLFGILVLDLVEYLTSFLMEKLFHARWWDYTNEILNLNGRICLKHTLYWGIASMCYVYVMQSPYLQLYSLIPQNARYIALGVILVIFVIDLANAVRNAMDVKSFMSKLSGLRTRLSDLKTRLTGTTTAAVDSDDVSALSKELDDLRPEDYMTIFVDRKNSGGKPRLNRMYKVYQNLRRSAEGSVAAAEDLLGEIKRHFTDDDGEMY